MPYILSYNNDHVNIFNLLILLSCNFNHFNSFVTLAHIRLRPPEDDADASKHVGVIKIYKILLIHTHIYIYIYIHTYSAFVDLEN